jgi:hypothetical protein
MDLNLQQNNFFDESIPINNNNNEYEYSKINNDTLKINNNIKTGIGPITDNLINDCLKKLSSCEIKDKIVKNLLDPLFNDISGKLQPYLYLISALYAIILILIVIIIYLIITKK